MKRVAPALAWLVLLSTLLIAIGWGSHAPNSWDVDNIAPGSVLRGLAVRFGPGWHSSYGPVPYVLVAILYVPLLLIFRAAGELGVPVSGYPWGFLHPELSVGALTIGARLLCVALAAGIAVMAVRERWSPRGAWLVPLLLAGSPTFVYYARTTNVDMFYLFFLALAFHLATRDGGWRTRALAAAAAALAICCKEQAAPLAVAAAATAAWRGARGAGGALGRARAVLVVGAAALTAYVLAWGLPWNLRGWLAHSQFLFEQARYARDFPASLPGFAALAGRSAELLPVSIGWPILAGTTFAMFARERGKGLAPRLLGLGLYLAGFLGVIGYVYPRFLLPVLLVALPLAVRGWSILLDRAGRAAPLAVAGLLVLTALGGPLLGMAQWSDSRTVAARWLSRHEVAGASAEIVGNARFQARVPPAYRLTATSLDSLRNAPRGPGADVVLMSSFDRYVVERDSLLRRIWWEPLTAAGGEYVLAADIPPPAWSKPVRGLPFSPVIWIWVRRAGPIRP